MNLGENYTTKLSVEFSIAFLIKTVRRLIWYNASVVYIMHFLTKYARVMIEFKYVQRQEKSVVKIQNS